MWFILSLLSVSALAVAELTQQRLLNTKNPFTPRTSAVITFVFQSLVMIPFIIFSPLRFELFEVFYNDNLWKFLLVTFLSSISMVFYLKSFQVKNISFSVIFISFSVVVSTFLGIIFFNEVTTLTKLLGIGLVLFAIVSANYKNSVLEKNHFYGLLAGLMFGVQYTLDKGIVLSIDPVVYIFWAFFMVAFFGVLLNPKEVMGSIKNKSFNAYKIIIYSGVGYVLYNLLTFYSYVVGGEVGRVDAINNSQVFLIILFEYFVLKHTTSVVRKLLTALIAFVGVLLLGLT